MAEYAENILATVTPSLHEAVRLELEGKPISYVRAYVAKVAPPETGGAIARFRYVFSENAIKYEVANTVLTDLEKELEDG